MIYLRCAKSQGNKILTQGKVTVSIDDKTTKIIHNKPARMIALTPVTKKSVIVGKIEFDSFVPSKKSDGSYTFYIRKVYERYTAEQERKKLEAKKKC